MNLKNQGIAIGILQLLVYMSSCKHFQFWAAICKLVFLFARLIINISLFWIMVIAMKICYYLEFRPGYNYFFDFLPAILNLGFLLALHIIKNSLLGFMYGKNTSTSVSAILHSCQVLSISGIWVAILNFIFLIALHIVITSSFGLLDIENVGTLIHNYNFREILWDENMPNGN